MTRLARGWCEGTMTCQEPPVSALWWPRDSVPVSTAGPTLGATHGAPSTAATLARLPARPPRARPPHRGGLRGHSGERMRQTSDVLAPELPRRASRPLCCRCPGKSQQPSEALLLPASEGAWEWQRPHEAQAEPFRNTSEITAAGKSGKWAQVSVGAWPRGAGFRGRRARLGPTWCPCCVRPGP